MTERWEDGLGTGPDGLVVPGDLDPDAGSEAPELLAEPPYRGLLEERMAGMETLLASLARKVPDLSALDRHMKEQHREILSAKNTLWDLSIDLKMVRTDLLDQARESTVEDILRNQRHGFDYMRESLAWTRGAATAGAPAPRPDPAPRSRAGVAALVLLWALTVAAAFGFGAVAFGGLQVDIAWEQGRARPAAVERTSRHIDSVNERRLERALSEGFREGLVVEPTPLEAVPPGEEIRPSVVPSASNRDLAIPDEEFRPPYGSPRRGPPVAEPGTP